MDSKPYDNDTDKTSKREVFSAEKVPLAPTKELEIPPDKSQEKINYVKWLHNTNFAKYLIMTMAVVYIADLLVSGGNSTLKEPFFEVLKITLFTVTGFVFAKNN